MSISANSLSAVSPLLNDREKVELLTAVNDNYEGVIVEIKAPMDSGAFAASLKASILNWRKQGKKGIWIKLPIEFANLVQPAIEEGFWYHHAEPSYLMLVNWLPSTKHTLPVNATHRVGVGAFVMNNKREVLTVQEKNGMFRGSGVWKVPTGVIDQGEDMLAGAIREVKEETGIDTEFVEILLFRQLHKSFFEKSDLFFACMLRPLSFDIQIQESELEAAQWMPIEEYAAQPFVQNHELSKCIVDAGLASFERGYAGFSPVPIKSAYFDGQGYIYLNSRDLNRASRSGNVSQNS